MLSLIVAFSENNVIGNKNELPWYLPSDLRNFKNITTGKSVVMGRNTFDSIGRPLPNRHNVVVTTKTEQELFALYPLFKESNLTFVDSLPLVNLSPIEQIFIGGAAVYREALKIVDRMYITRVHISCSGDTFFPEYSQNEWRTVESMLVVDEKSYLKEGPNKFPLTYTFNILERLKQ